MAEKAKTITDIEKADAFYDAVMKYKEKIEKTENGLKTIETSGKYKEYDAEEAKAIEAMAELNGLSDAQKDMVDSNKDVRLEYNAREALLTQKEKYLENVAALEGQIKTAISKYIVDTEKEQKKLEKNKEKYATYVEEEKTKCEALKAELEEMDKEDVTYEDKKAELDALVLRIEDMDKKLASFDERLAKIVEELNINKEKYKEYIDLAKEDLIAPELSEEEKAEVGSDSDKEEKNEPEPEPEQETVKEENEGKEKDKTVKATRATKVVSPVVDVEYKEVSDEEKETGAEAKEEKPKETDKQAFKRIYKSLKKKETLSVEDTEKMIELLSDKSNFARFNIATSSILPFFKSKGERIYTSLGKELEKQIKEVVKDEELLKNLKTRDITHWKSIIELGHDNPANNIVDTIDSVMETADEKKQEALTALKERYEKFGNSAKVLTNVKLERKEIGFKALPASKDAEEVEVADVSLKGMSEELSGMVKSDSEIAKDEAEKENAEVERVAHKVTEDKTI